MPDTVIAFETMNVFSATFVWAVKLKASGVVSAARVVTLNPAELPPIVSVAVVVVEKLAEDVWRTVTVWPFDTVPAVVVYAPPLIAYSPPLTEIAVGASTPDTVIALDTMTVLRATSVWAVKLKAPGVVSAARVVTLNPAETPPIVSVAVVVVEKLAEEV